MGVRLAGIAVVLALAGCQFLPGHSAPAVSGAQALQIPKVTVETLGAPEQPRDTKITPNGDAVSVADPAPAPFVPKASLPAAVPPAAIVKSPQRLACEKQGGDFVIVGNSGAMACQSGTKDAGKTCNSSDECDGSCLARSRSCAPVKPLFGCNDILEAGSRLVSLCIE